MCSAQLASLCPSSLKTLAPCLLAESISLNDVERILPLVKSVQCDEMQSCAALERQQGICCTRRSSYCNPNHLYPTFFVTSPNADMRLAEVDADDGTLPHVSANVENA